jgi:Family of unknown function (DUF6812)
MHFRRLRVRLETERHAIEGTLQLPNEGYRSRMTDFLNSHDSDFLPITEARVSWLGSERPPESHEYLAVSVRHIVLGVELESLGTFDETGEPPTETRFMVSTPPPSTG